MRTMRPIRSLPLLLAAVAVATCAGGYGKPESPAAQLAFGVKMAQQQLWSEALFRFRQAERLDPGNPRIYNNMAVALEATGRYDEALEYYQKALKAAPGNADLKRNYARFSEFYASYQRPQDEATPAETGGDAPEPGAESTSGDG